MNMIFAGMIAISIALISAASSYASSSNASDKPVVVDGTTPREEKSSNENKDDSKDKAAKPTLKQSESPFNTEPSGVYGGGDAYGGYGNKEFRQPNKFGGF